MITFCYKIILLKVQSKLFVLQIQSYLFLAAFCLDVNTSKISLFCFKYRVNANYDNNKIMHILNGNIAYSKDYKKIKIAHFNKGNYNFANRVSEIQIVLKKFNPDILCVSEANVKSNFKCYVNQFPEFYFELNKMHNTIGLSRNIMMVSKKLCYKRRYDLEQDLTCTIWIEIKTSQKKGICRSEKKQAERYGGLLQCWENALTETRDTIVLMDDNIDSSINAKHNKMFKIAKLYQMLQNHINSNLLTCHNSNFTRYVPHQPPSPCLDHVYSNCPQNFFNVTSDMTIFSDHVVICVTYKSNFKLYQPKFFNVRNHKLLTKKQNKKLFTG